MLLKFDIKINSYIDVSPKLTNKRIDGLPVYHFQDFSIYHNKFILSYVGNRNSRLEIKIIYKIKA